MNCEAAVFISHSTKDDPVVHAIRDALQGLGVPVWADSYRLTGGDALEPAITRAIDDAPHAIAVLSTHAINSPWVRKEIQYALKKQAAHPGFKVIPVMLDGIEPPALALWFDTEPVGVKIKLGPGGIQNALPDLLAALGVQLPVGYQPPTSTPSIPVADLLVGLSHLELDLSEGKRRAVAEAFLVYNPPDASPPVQGGRFRVVAPLGPIEAEELAWYLERYIDWPSPHFRERAAQVEEALPTWGKALHDLLNHPKAREALDAWKRADAGATHRLTIEVDDDCAETDAPRIAAAREAATLWLSFPWELIHDDHGYLFQRANAVRVRRRLPNTIKKNPLVTDPPVRVLLVSPRPEEAGIGYIDHRVSARPLVEALATLGDLATFTLLSPPTFPALVAELQRARDAKAPYHVVHFDGHGLYDPVHGLGKLYFENPEDVARLDHRRAKPIDARDLGQAMKAHRVPLVFLEAFQPVHAEKDPTASVAGRLLQEGVASVVAMSHPVLVETARRFITEFYQQLLKGRRIGDAVLAGQRVLWSDRFRGKVFQYELEIHDWFVPVLFQEDDDPRLVHETPGKPVHDVLRRLRERAVGEAFPPSPAHSFVGRSRELLTVERLLARERFVVLRGEGGEGKTTLAAELVRWLIDTRRFRRGAFFSLENRGDAHAALHAIGAQIVTGFVPGGDDQEAWKHVERALNDHPTLIVLDNMESVLPPAANSDAALAFDPDVLQGLLDLAAKLAKVGETRVIFTSREAMPEPFAPSTIAMDRLDRRDAIALVGRVLGEGRLRPQASDAGESEAEIEALVEAVNGHARSLVLLAGEIAREGVRHTTENLHQLMADLHARYPDDRERSLFASVELSLRRLPAPLRARLGPLGVLQGGANRGPLKKVLGLKNHSNDDIPIAQSLVSVGLAELMPYGCLRLHPALPPLLLDTLTPAEREAARVAWAEAMEELAEDTTQRQHREPQVASGLTLFELPNLLAALEYVRRTANAERTTRFASMIEEITRGLGRPRVLDQVSRIRAEAMKQLSGWDHMHFIARSAEVQRLLDAGRFSEAVATARALLDRAQIAGASAYDSADYDLAIAHNLLGQTFLGSGNPRSALAPLAEARRRFESLAAAGNAMAIAMINKMRIREADALRDLGQLDEAARTYESAIECACQSGLRRDAAVALGSLGRVRLLQRRHVEALHAYEQARDEFQDFGLPDDVASSWHQIGNVHLDSGNLAAAEQAYREALKLKVQIGNRAREASTLGQLGLLYVTMNRHEDAVPMFRRSAEICAAPEIGDLAGEGRARTNTAAALLVLGRYDEARRELARAIVCNQPFGHAAQPWKALGTLADLERAAGNPTAAAAARDQAIAAYLAYRRDGGENLEATRPMYEAVENAIHTGQRNAVAARLDHTARAPGIPDEFHPLIPALLAILKGERNPALAENPALLYIDAVELRLLLERLASHP